MIFRVKSVGVFLLFLFVPEIMISQDAQTTISSRWEAITVDDGLCYRHVTAIVQDKEGLMWFGTTNGLSRFDGYRFLSFGSTSTSDQFFPANDIRENGLLNCSDSSLWVVADHQLFEFNTQTFQSKKFQINGEVLEILNDDKNDPWLISQNGIHQFIWRFTEADGFQKIDSVRQTGYTLTDIELDTSGHLWWSSMAEGLREYTAEGVFMNAYQIDSFEWHGQIGYYTDFMIDHQNQFYIYSRNKSLSHQVCKYDFSNGEKDILLANQANILIDIEQDSRGDIWMTTEGGLQRLDTKGRMSDFGSEVQQKQDFSMIHAIYEDKSNILWLGTDGGLLKLPIQKKLFKNILSNPILGWGNAMRGITEDDDGNTFFFCENGDIGLFHLDRQTCELAKMDFGLDEKNVFDKIGLANFFKYDSKRNSLWTVTQELLEIDLSQNTIIPHSQVSFPREISNFNPIDILPDGRLLVGNAFQKLGIYNPNKKSFAPFFENDVGPLSGAIVKFILIKNQNEYWISTAANGIYLINSEGEVLRAFDSNSDPSISSEQILAMYWDEAKSLLWVGFFGAGINCIDLQNNTVSRFAEKDGLPNNNVASILGTEGNLWIGTYDGLSYFEVEENSFRNFFVDDGLSHNEFNFSSAFKSENGRLYFGGMNGVNSFIPTDILEQRESPPLKLTKLTVYDQKVGEVIEHQKRPLSDQRIEISPNVSYFQFEFSLPNYLNPEQNQYYTWMEGLENDWSFLGSIPNIRFNKLPAGEYTLHLKGKDSRGNWNVRPLKIPIIVRRPWYKTWWFYSLCLLGAGGIIYAVFQNRLRHLLELEKLRTKISSDLHDDLGSMLSGLAMQSEIMESVASEADKPRLQKISKTSRQAVHRMRDLVWSIDARKDRMSDLILKMRETAEDLLLPADIQYTFDVKGFPKREKRLSINFRQNIFLIFKEALNNMLKHSNGDTFKVTLINQSDQILFCIEDNGQILPENKKEFWSGQGLMNMKMRINHLKGEIEFDGDTGFQILMKIPNKQMYNA